MSSWVVAAVLAALAGTLLTFGQNWGDWFADRLQGEDLAADTVETPAPTSGADPASSNSAWPNLGALDPVVLSNKAATDGASAPDFPTAVEGYRLDREETLTSRAFWQLGSEVHGVPATMNGCGNQRFYFRWKARDPRASVEAYWTFPGKRIDVEGYPIEPPINEAGGTAVGTAGWMSGHGCTLPAFRVVDYLNYTERGNPLTDVVVEMQVWTPVV